jgi:predicted Rossmann fold nucleotide-binding protein DprA/Smf involved in DNA uptake
MTDSKLKRIAVIGSRDFEDYARLESVLAHHLPAVLVSGGAKGADALAERLAGVPVEVHHPDGTVTD